MLICVLVIINVEKVAFLNTFVESVIHCFWIFNNNNNILHIIIYIYIITYNNQLIISIICICVYVCTAQPEIHDAAADLKINFSYCSLLFYGFPAVSWAESTNLLLPALSPKISSYVHQTDICELVFLPVHCIRNESQLKKSKNDALPIITSQKQWKTSTQGFRAQERV